MEQLSEPIVYTWAIGGDTQGAKRLLVAMHDVTAFHAVPPIRILTHRVNETFVEYAKTFPNVTTVEATGDLLDPLFADLDRSKANTFVLVSPEHLAVGPIPWHSYTLPGLYMREGHDYFVVAMGRSAVATVRSHVARYGAMGGLSRHRTRSLTRGDVDVIDGLRDGMAEFGEGSAETVGRFAVRPTLVYPGPNTAAVPTRPLKRHTHPGPDLARAIAFHRARLDDRVAALDWVTPGPACPMEGGVRETHAFVWFIALGDKANLYQYTRYSLFSAMAMRTVSDARLIFVYQNDIPDPEAAAAMAELGIERVIIPDRLPADLLAAMNPLRETYKKAAEKLNVMRLNTYLPADRQLDRIVTLDADMTALRDPGRVFCHPSPMWAVSERQQDWGLNGGLVGYDLTRVGPHTLDAIADFGRDGGNACLFDRAWAFSEQEMLTCFLLNGRRNLPLLGTSAAIQDAFIWDAMVPALHDVLILHRNAGHGMYNWPVNPVTKYVVLRHQRYFLRLIECLSGREPWGRAIVTDLAPGICERCQCAHTETKGRRRADFETFAGIK